MNYVEDAKNLIPDTFRASEFNLANRTITGFQRKTQSNPHLSYYNHWYFHI